METQGSLRPTRFHLDALENSDSSTIDGNVGDMLEMA